MNGYVEKEGENFLWVAKRSQTKPTFPGMLDHLVAGGLVRNKLELLQVSLHVLLSRENVKNDDYSVFLHDWMISGC